MNKEKIIIFDTTMRDGEQTPGVVLSARDKIMLGLQLQKLGVDVIEAGFPANSLQETEAVRAVANKVRGPIICGLARAIFSDIDFAWQAVKEARQPRIHVFLSSSDIHLNSQLLMCKKDVLEMAIQSIRYARSYCPDIEFSPMDATRTEPEFLYQITEAAICSGATTINIADTVGYSYPEEFASLIRNIKNKSNVPSIDKVILSVHCHDDLGMAVANSVSAINAGARQIEGCINGIGERAGNASLEEIIMAIKVRGNKLNCYTDIKTGEIYTTGRMVERLTGIEIPVCKAIIGKNAFSHESGVHQDGMIKNPETYEIMRPESVGRNGSKLVLGKTSGKAGFRKKLEELGIDLSQGEFDSVHRGVKALINSRILITDEAINQLVVGVR